MNFGLGWGTVRASLQSGALGLTPPLRKGRRGKSSVAEAPSSHLVWFRAAGDSGLAHAKQMLCHQATLLVSTKGAFWKVTSTTAIRDMLVKSLESMLTLKVSHPCIPMHTHAQVYLHTHTHVPMCTKIPIHTYVHPTNIYMVERERNSLEGILSPRSGHRE